MLDRWSQYMRGEGWWAALKPSDSTIFVLELCISDQNKSLLLAESNFIPYLVDALRVNDSQHPRYNLKDEQKVWVETYHAECVHQLALYPAGREALLSDASVSVVLETVSTRGMCEQSRNFALAALVTLSGKELDKATGGQKHVMLSYQWDYQATIIRVDKSLQSRGYLTWFDLTNMK